MKLLPILRKLPFYNSFVNLYAGIATKLFHILYYSRGKQTWRNTTWFGTELLKCPLDLWIYQEMIHELKPDVIVECGTHRGGSAFFLANLLDLAGKGRILTVDIKRMEGQPEHPRVKYMLGSTSSEETFQQVKMELNPGENVLLILDSNHEKNHVLAELKLFSELVPVGGYVIVEDTNLTGHPIFKAYGPGPMEAVHEFMKLPQGKNFRIDKSKEKFFLTFNPNGYLQRIS